ncbi:hypothetical protein [Acidimangrovimonas sediminis]|uniref:hypothetical protein n=1 Tax=Acidimangrovimonas sediminis TaxID=2056283 RepID=UPI000C800AB5|nr:hypothetical protein [Acidimangrovimonas sediminis]
MTEHASSALPGAAPIPGRRSRVKRRERRLAKPAELALVLLLLSGAAMFDGFGLPWALVRGTMALHAALAVALVPLLVIPFWRAHRGRVATSARRFHRVSGRVLEWGLGLVFLSGAWLLFVGWNGTVTGGTAHWAHLILGLPLVVLLLVHAWRFSVMRTALGLGAVIALTLAGAQTAHSATTESRTLLMEPGGTLLAATGDGGAVSRIDPKAGTLLAEAAPGGDIAAVAEGGGTIAATDFARSRLFTLDPGTLKIRNTIPLPGRPSGVVWDRRNHVFWIAATEGDRLYAVTPGGHVSQALKTEESPKGLALLADGRLLVSHQLIGAVSVYDTTRMPPVRTQLIRLAETSAPDQTVSQGLPRGLDRIAVSPDGKQAWLPHMLWNFDHPFQFQSTVFPAISVLRIGADKITEVPSRRKQLFKQINVLEDGNRTRIVSNPADVAFSNDGSKAYVTMSGSEDLVVFDLSRALPIDSHSKKARTTDGAAAVQIYRHLPGEMPTGIVVAGKDIWIQNAQGLDLTRATTGGAGPFARVKMVKDHAVVLQRKDPLPPALRRGDRLFHLANTAAMPDAPMTGDNWMSCSSCHIDGFNYTNRALFRATPVDKFTSSVTGHGSIKHLVAGDFVGDYIRMVKNTQGGMGADTRFPAPDIDPDAPPAQVRKAMEDLHDYVTAPGNLPLLATWLRAGDGGDHVDPAAWGGAATCATCHSAITRQWADSLHRVGAGSDPYYVTLEDLAAKTEGEPFRAWCMGCHAPEALLSGARKTTAQAELFTRGGRFRQTAAPLTLHAPDEGAGCLTCHAVSKIEASGPSLGGNASLNLAPDTRPTYPLETSDSALLRKIAGRLIRAKPEKHATSLMRNLGGGSTPLCAACHEEYAPGTGAVIVDTYDEWAASPYNAPGTAANRNCADCHMHATVAKIGTPVPGRSTDGGPLKADVRTHGFTGAQYHLAGLRDPARRAESVALLQSAARLGARVDGGRLVVRVSNTGAGHDLPTGVSDFRQMWLQITATDATGRVVLRSGQLDPGGHLDPDARIFNKVLADGSAHGVGLAFWRLRKFAGDTRIPARGHRDEAFALPADTAYPLRVTARLLFRTFPQAVTDVVRARFPLMPPPEPVEMATLSEVLETP